MEVYRQLSTLDSLDSLHYGSRRFCRPTDQRWDLGDYALAQHQGPVKRWRVYESGRNGAGFFRARSIEAACGVYFACNRCFCRKSTARTTHLGGRFSTKRSGWELEKAKVSKIITDVSFHLLNLQRNNGIRSCTTTPHLLTLVFVGQSLLTYGVVVIWAPTGGFWVNMASPRTLSTSHDSHDRFHSWHSKLRIMETLQPVACRNTWPPIVGPLQLNLTWCKRTWAVSSMTSKGTWSKTNWCNQNLMALPNLTDRDDDYSFFEVVCLISFL